LLTVFRVFRAAKVTVDLDVQVRDDLLSFLKEDSQHRNATILCGFAESLIICELMPTTLDATHIFDGLNGFPTHVAHMSLGSFVMNPTPWPLPPIDPPLSNTERAPDLFQVALQWLREDRVHRRELEKAGRKTRGARHGQVRKLYDYLGCAHRTCSRLCHQVPRRSIRSTWMTVDLNGVDWLSYRYDYSH